MMQEDGAAIQTWRRKRNRLDHEAYQGPRLFLITVVTWQRNRPFTQSAEVDGCVALLQAAAQRSGFRVLAYCFMPDHLHVVVEGFDRSDLAGFMKRFKQTSSYEYKKRSGTPLWQRSYYDHVVRGDDDLPAAIDYVLANPVRAGLVEDPEAYPFLGGLVLSEELVAT